MQKYKYGNTEKLIPSCRRGDGRDRGSKARTAASHTCTLLSYIYLSFGLWNNHLTPAPFWYLFWFWSSYHFENWNEINEKSFVFSMASFQMKPPNGSITRHHMFVMKMTTRKKFQMKLPGKTPCQTFKIVELSGFDPVLLFVELSLPLWHIHMCFFSFFVFVECLECGLWNVPFQPFLVCGILACASLTSSSLLV